MQRGAAVALNTAAQFSPLFVDRGNDEAHRHAKIHKDGLGKLQARFDRFRHRIGHALCVKPFRMFRVAGAGDDA